MTPSRNPPASRGGPPGGSARRRLARTVVAAVGWFAALGAVPAARALDPGRALTQYQRQSWGPEEGLPCDSVTAIVQATDGYLWLGTEEGLVRFDGVRARVFDRQTDPLLRSNNIFDVVEDAQRPGQLLLLGSTGGVYRFDGEKVQEFSPDPALANQPGRVLVQDPADGALWVGTVRGLFRVRPDGTVTDPAAVPPPGWPAGAIRTMCRDGAGCLWVGTAQGLYRQRRTGADRRFDLLPAWAGRAVDCLAPARGGGLWVGSRDAGSGRLAEDGTFRPRAALAGCSVTAFLEDRQGMLWAGTHGSGLFRLRANDGEAGPGPPAASGFTTANGLVDNEVNSLCEDREGNLWIATQKGIQVLRDARFVTFGRPEGLGGNDVRTVFGDARGRLWMGHENGLGVLDPAAAGSGLENYPPPPSSRRPGDNLVLCVSPGDEDDTLLAGTHAGLLRWRAGKLEPFPLREDLDGSAVRALCVDAAGDRWVGTGAGLYQVRAGRVRARLTTAEGLADDLVRALHVDRRGNLWVATDGGLSRRGPDGRIVNFLTTGAGSVLSFYEDPAGDPGDLFVGTELGLHRLRATADGGERVTAYTVREGLFNDVVWALLDDGRGNLWMSSNKGISRVARADLDRLDRREITTLPHVAYGLGDGLRSREANGGVQPAGWRDHAGRLWFATVKGAVAVDPDRALAPDPLSPPVHVEELTADGRPVARTADRAPELPAGTQKFGLRYTALGLSAPETTRFRTRLEPFEKGWTEAGPERVAHYTNLPPGAYRFRVQAANPDGAWDATGATLAFSLRPHPWQTGWFRVLAAGAALGLGWGWLRRHQRHLVARLAQAEADVRERTRTQETLRAATARAERALAEAELARAEAERASRAKSEFLSRVSHELRTPLNAILGFGQLLEMDDHLSPGQSESVEHILGGGRHLLGLVDEVLDLASIESGHVPLSAEDFEVGPLLRETLELVAPLARGSGVRLDLDPAGGAAVRADRQRLRQVLLNLFSNAVKYNRPVGGEVFVSARVGEGSGPGAPAGVRVRVRDTGAGLGAAESARLFTPFERLGAAYGPIKGTGLGLAVSKQLAEAMGGTIGLDSAPGQGSTFWVELPAAGAPLPAGARELV